MSRIEVVDWSPRWAEQYDAVAAVLRQALAGIASATVEHVGSTSVPGLAAKPILDIDVVVDAQDVPGGISDLEFARASAAAQELAAGFEWDTDREADAISA